MQRKSILVIISAMICLVGATTVSAQGTMEIVGIDTIKWMPCDPNADDPSACQLAYFRGDPGKEPNHKMVKAKGGFKFPAHWHTGNENLVITKGLVTIAAEGGQEQETLLTVGDYLRIPARRVHWGSCPVECIFYLYVDGPDSYYDAMAQRP